MKLATLIAAAAFAIFPVAFSLVLPKREDEPIDETAPIGLGDPDGYCVDILDPSNTDYDMANYPVR